MPFADVVAVVLVVDGDNALLTTVHGPLDDADCDSTRYVVEPDVAASNFHDSGTEPDPTAGCVAVSEAGAFGAATVVNPLIAMTLLDVYALQPTELHAATPK
jgi:hypothetical protein